MNKGMIKQAWQKYKKLPVQIRASFWFLACSFLQKGVSVLTTPIFTRLLSPEEYGQYGVFTSWYNIISIFVALRLSAGMYTQGLVKYSERRDQFASSMQGLALTLTSIWTVIYLLFHTFWNNLLMLTAVQMLALLAMVWTSTVVGFWNASQRVGYCYRKLVLVTVLVAVAKPTVGIFLVTHAQNKVTARILGLALVELICYTGLFFSQLKRGKVFYSAKFWKHALLFNLPLIPHYLSNTVLNSADRIMIKKMVGDGPSGIYGLAYSVSLVMTMFNSALVQTLEPWLYQKIKAHRENDIAGTAYLSLLLIAGVNLALIALAPEAVAIFAPKAYYEAIWVIPPVAMSTIFTFSYDLFSCFAFYYEKTKFIAGASVISALLNILLNYIFIQKYGYIAAGYTTLICYMAYAAAHYLCMLRICEGYGHNQNYYNLKILLGIYIGFFLCGFLLAATYEQPIIRYGIIAAALVAAFIYHRKILAILQHLRNLRK